MKLSCHTICNHIVTAVLHAQLSSVLAEVGLNIREAHVFSTDDGYSLDVFLVDGWPTEVQDSLPNALPSFIYQSPFSIIFSFGVNVIIECILYLVLQQL